MRAALVLHAALAAPAPAACGNTSAEPPAESGRETSRPPGALPDAYKHPPK